MADINIKARLSAQADEILAKLISTTGWTKKTAIDQLIEGGADLVGKALVCPEDYGSEDYEVRRRSWERLQADLKKENSGAKKQCLAISQQSKDKLKSIAQKTGLGSGIVLSIILMTYHERMKSSEQRELDRDYKANQLLGTILEKREQIKSVVLEMEFAWHELLRMYEQKNDSPAYDELLYFFDGFHQMGFYKD